MQIKIQLFGAVFSLLHYFGNVTSFWRDNKTCARRGMSASLTEMKRKANEEGGDGLQDIFEIPQYFIICFCNELFVCFNLISQSYSFQERWFIIFASIGYIFIVQDTGSCATI